MEKVGVRPRTQGQILKKKFWVFTTFTIYTLGALYAFYLGFTEGIHLYSLCIFLLIYISAGISATAGFHRYFSHRSYECSTGVKLFYIIAGSLVSGSITEWAALHRRHHRFSDLEGDNHSPYKYKGTGARVWIKNFFNAHIFWLWTDDLTDNERYIPDIMRDSTLVRADNLTWLWISLAWLIPPTLGYFIIGGPQGALRGFVWGTCLPAFIGLNAMTGINSFAHLFGKRVYNSGDMSYNNMFIVLTGFGEGWHNNHHAFQSSPRFGFDRFQWDPGWYFIKLLEFMGLAWNVRPAPTQVARDRKRIVEEDKGVFDSSKNLRPSRNLKTLKNI